MWGRPDYTYIYALANTYLKHLALMSWAGAYIFNNL